MGSNLEISAEDQLLIFCAHTQLNNESKDHIIELINYNFEWDSFVKKATYHKLKPLIYLNLKDYKTLVPNDIFNDLNLFFSENAKKNLFFLMELKKILEIFEEHEIPVIPYKGPTLAYFAYGDLSLRQFSDLDFLVYPKDVEQAKNLLYSMGYESELKLNKMQEKKFISSQQELKFFNKQNNMTVDLHWKLSLLHATKTDYLIQNTTTVELFNKSIRTLRSEEMFLVICIHNSSHRWSTLSLLCDLSEFISRNETLDWSKINSLAKKMGLTRIVNINLLLIKNVLNLNLYPEHMDINKDTKTVKIACKIQKKILKGIFTFSLVEELMITIRIRDNRLLGLQDVVTNLFKATSYEWKKISLPSEISFIYIILRPILLLTRYKI